MTDTKITWLQMLRLRRRIPRFDAVGCFGCRAEELSNYERQVTPCLQPEHREAFSRFYNVPEEQLFDEKGFARFYDEDEEPMTLLRKLREDQRWGLERVARGVEFKSSYISEFEYRVKPCLPPDFRRALSMFYGVPEERLFDEKHFARFYEKANE
jgi:hypothetical protein